LRKRKRKARPGGRSLAEFTIATAAGFAVTFRIRGESVPSRLPSVPTAASVANVAVVSRQFRREMQTRHVPASVQSEPQSDKDIREGCGQNRGRGSTDLARKVSVFLALLFHPQPRDGRLSTVQNRLASHLLDCRLEKLQLLQSPASIAERFFYYTYVRSFRITAMSLSNYTPKRLE